MKDGTKTDNGICIQTMPTWNYFSFAQPWFFFENFFWTFFFELFFFAVETGRHFHVVIPRDQRLCSCGEMEDEIHFILHCPHYSHIRKKYFDSETSISVMLDNSVTPDFIQELTKLRKLYRWSSNGPLIIEEERKKKEDYEEF